MYYYYYCYVCSVPGILFPFVVLCVICVQLCAVPLPPGVNPIAVNKCIISYHIIVLPISGMCVSVSKWQTLKYV